MFGDILIESRGKISDGTKSAMVGIVKHIRSLRNSPRIDCTVICTVPFDSVFVPFIAPIGNECAITAAFKYFTKY